MYDLYIKAVRCSCILWYMQVRNNFIIVMLIFVLSLPPSYIVSNIDQLLSTVVYGFSYGKTLISLIEC